MRPAFELGKRRDSRGLRVISVALCVLVAISIMLNVAIIVILLEEDGK
jgi:hypothetical protein